MLLHSGMDGADAVVALETHVYHSLRETPAGGPLGETPRPGLVHARCARLPGRTEVTRRVHGRPQATFVLRCKNITRLQGGVRPRTYRSGLFRPPHPSSPLFYPISVIDHPITEQEAEAERGEAISRGTQLTSQSRDSNPGCLPALEL